MIKRYVIYYVNGRLAKYPHQPKDGFSYEYEAEMRIKSIVEGGGLDSIRQYTIIKTFTYAIE